MRVGSGLVVGLVGDDVVPVEDVVVVEGATEDISIAEEGGEVTEENIKDGRLHQRV